MSKLSGVVYKVKSSGQSTEPCGTLMRVTSTESSILMDLCLIVKYENQIFAWPDIPYHSENVFVNVAWL